MYVLDRLAYIWLLQYSSSTGKFVYMYTSPLADGETSLIRLTTQWTTPKLYLKATIDHAILL